MDAKVQRKLAERGLVEETAEGVPGVRVSLQYRPPVGGGASSRAERRQFLEDAFRTIGERLTRRQAAVDLDSLSVSGQTVEAVLPLEQFDELTKELEQEQVRVDMLVDREVV